jgi:hypothetical protein
VKRVAGVRGVRRGWGGGPIPPRGRVVGLRHSKTVCRRTLYKAVRVGVSLVFELVLKSDKGSFFSGQKVFPFSGQIFTSNTKGPGDGRGASARVRIGRMTTDEVGFGFACVGRTGCRRTRPAWV